MSWLRRLAWRLVRNIFAEEVDSEWWDGRADGRRLERESPRFEPEALRRLQDADFERGPEWALQSPEAEGEGSG